MAIILKFKGAVGSPIYYIWIIHSFQIDLIKNILPIVVILHVLVLPLALHLTCLLCRETVAVKDNVEIMLLF